VLSEVQGDGRKVTHAYVIFMFLVGVFAGSVSWGMIPAAHDLVLTLLGSQWIPAIPVVQVLAIAVPFNFLAHIHGIILDSRAALRVKLKVQLLSILVLVVLLLGFSHFGILGIAAAVACAEFIRFLMYAVVMKRLLLVPMVDLLKVFAGVVGVAFTTTSVIVTTVFAVDRTSLPVPGRLMVEISTAALTLALVFSWVWARMATMEAFQLLEAKMPVLRDVGRFGTRIWKHRA